MEGNEIKLFISGDFCPSSKFEDVEENNYSALFGDVKELISDVDLAITNLECPLTEATNPIEKTGPALKAKPRLIKILKEANFNLVTLANNHIMDYKANGLQDTIKTLKDNEIDYVGAALEGSKASDIYYYKKKGATLAILNFSENEWSTTTDESAGANPVDPIRNYHLIKEAKANAEGVLVIHHGGNELSNLPSPKLKDLLRFYVDIGADIVINHHTHYISGYELYNDKPIFYSLGNFIFDNDNYKNSDWNLGLALQLTWESGSFNFNILSFEQCNGKLGVRLNSKEEHLEILKRIEAFNEIIGCKSKLKESYKKYGKSKERMYLSYLEPHRNKYIMALQNRNLLPRFWTRKKRLLLLNLIRCESHREALIKILENETSHT